MIIKHNKVMALMQFIDISFVFFNNITYMPVTTGCG